MAHPQLLEDPMPRMHPCPTVSGPPRARKQEMDFLMGHTRPTDSPTASLAGHLRNSSSNISPLHSKEHNRVRVLTPLIPTATTSTEHQLIMPDRRAPVRLQVGASSIHIHSRSNSNSSNINSSDHHLIREICQDSKVARRINLHA